MDGTVRVNGGTNPANNDYQFLIINILGGNINNVITQHQEKKCLALYFFRKHPQQ